MIVKHRFGTHVSEARIERTFAIVLVDKTVVDS